MKRFKTILTGFFLLLLTSCEDNNVIVTGIDEREANIIIVLLQSKGIPSKKIETASSPGAQAEGVKFNITVPESHQVEAISFLNQNGLPKKIGTSLLDLFAKQGLMSSEKEETIRYQAGLAQQITNMILMIDGVIDSTVQLSYPQQDTTGFGGAQQGKITAAVYVKHQGVIDDPNQHLEDKIKRLVSGSVSGLDMNDVTVVSDRARLSDLSVLAQMESPSEQDTNLVSVWSIVMSKESLGKFRFIFFFLSFFVVLFTVVSLWLLWKVFPLLKNKKGVRKLLDPAPLHFPENEER